MILDFGFRPKESEVKDDSTEKLTKNASTRSA
jgi:hypothetical protein